MEFRIAKVYVFYLSIFSVRSDWYLDTRKFNCWHLTDCSNDCGDGNQTLTIRPTCQLDRYFISDVFPCIGYEGCKGDWGTWAPLSQCSTTCDRGQRLFTRQCNHPLPDHLATDCVGDNIENRTCNLRGCPGSWSSWEDNGYCSTSCGNGTQIRRRRCDNPAPTNDGNECPGDNVTSVHCNIKECPGYWGEWTPFGECSTSCDEGQRLFTRECNHQLPGHFSADCVGDNIEKRTCNLRGCPGSWSCWEDDGYCSTSCGNGTQIRRRRCDNPAPTNDGNECPGDNVTSVHCNIKECRVYKWGHLKELNLTKDETKEVMKNELDELKSNLTIDSKNMSATIRKRISARDERPSAASVGYVGVAMLVIPLLIIICFDTQKFLAMVVNIYRKVCKRNSVQIANVE